MQKRNWWKLFFAIYILIVIKVIIFKYPYEELLKIAASWRRDVIFEGLGTANFKPFKTIKMYIDYSYKLNSVENLAGNVLAFVPLGFLFPYVAKDGERFFVMLLNAFVFVLGIEMFQLFSAFGAFDVDDILLNCLGASLGFGIYRLMQFWRKKRKGRYDGKFTENEAEVLDIALVLHADHGGGNNSTFTNVVISSTGTDIYSAIAGSIGSLKGPRHGGANLAVKKQMELAIQEISVHATDEQIQSIVCRILDKDFNDNSGLIYGIGHAVYTLSDPRSEILSEKCLELAKEKGRIDEFYFYQRFAKIAIEEIYKRKGNHVSTNVDFYSGLVYDMLNIPSDLYTLLFVVGRTVGWIAHNIENKLYSNRIIRPATKYVGGIKEYKNIEER